MPHCAFVLCHCCMNIKEAELPQCSSTVPPTDQTQYCEAVIPVCILHSVHLKNAMGRNFISHFNNIIQQHYTSHLMHKSLPLRLSSNKQVEINILKTHLSINIH